MVPIWPRSAGSAWASPWEALLLPGTERVGGDQVVRITKVMTTWCPPCLNLNEFTNQLISPQKIHCWLQFYFHHDFWLSLTSFHSITLVNGELTMQLKWMFPLLTELYQIHLRVPRSPENVMSLRMYRSDTIHFTQNIWNYHSEVTYYVFLCPKAYREEIEC